MMEQYSKNTDNKLFEAEKSSISEKFPWSVARENIALSIDHWEKQRIRILLLVNIFGTVIGAELGVKLSFAIIKDPFVIHVFPAV